MHRTETDTAESVRVTLTLNAGIYEEVKRISGKLGLRPATWMKMVVTSKVNDVELAFSENGAAGSVSNNDG